MRYLSGGIERMLQLREGRFIGPETERRMIRTMKAEKMLRCSVAFSQGYVTHMA